MPNTPKKIAVKTLSENCVLASPKANFENLDTNSPAIELMVDFTNSRAITVNESTGVDDALESMRTNRIRSLMVIGRHGEFSGLVTSMDLMGRKPMAYANEAGIPRSEVLVKHVMRAKNKLKAFTREGVEKAIIGDVVQTLRMLNEQHILVVEGDNEDMRICGLFSASDYKRALGMPFDSAVDTTIFAQTFADLQRVIGGKREVM